MTRNGILGVFLTVAAAAAPMAAQAALSRVTIGTNPAGTMYNTLGGGFAKVLQEKLNIQATARPYTGSSVYIPMLQRGEIELGINSSLDSTIAFRGTAPYPAAMTNLRGIASIWPLPYGYIAKASSDIRTIEDFKGKRVVTAFKGNVSLQGLNVAILATAGLTMADITPIEAAGLPEGVRALAEGRTDATSVALGTGTIKEAHATIPGGIRVIGLGRNEAALSEKMPGSWPGETKASPENVGVEKDTRIPYFGTYLNGSARMPADDVYTILKTLHQSWASLQQDYPALRRTQASELAPADNPHPYHDGAVRYYKEIGVWTAANEAQQQKLLGK